jgi:hypothetical protein
MKNEQISVIFINVNSKTCLLKDENCFTINVPHSKFVNNEYNCFVNSKVNKCNRLSLGIWSLHNHQTIKIIDFMDDLGLFTEVKRFLAKNKSVGLPSIKQCWQPP